MHQLAGGLFASGWTVEQMLDLTVEQLQFVAQSIMAHKVWQLNMVLQPVSEALDSGFKKGKVKGNKNKRRRTPNKAQSDKNLSPEQRDARMAVALAAMGIPIHDPK